MAIDKGQSGGPAIPATVAVQATSERLEKLIRAGEFSAAGRLPSERDLAQRFHVSRTTLRRALVALSESGVVASAPQSGWFLAGAPLGEPPRTLISFTEMARRRGVTPRTQVLSRRVRETTLDEAAALLTPPLSRVLEIERLRSLGSTAICIDQSVIVLDRVPGLDGVELEDRSLYDEMDRLGSRPARSNFVVEAIGADTREAELLGVPEGSPLLLGAETCFDAIGTALLIGRTRYRANAYRFYSTMVRR